MSERLERMEKGLLSWRQVETLNIFFLTEELEHMVQVPKAWSGTHEDKF